MPIFCVKSVKIYTGQKNLHGYTRGSRNKYQVCFQLALRPTRGAPDNFQTPAQFKLTMASPFTKRWKFEFQFLALQIIRSKLNMPSSKKSWYFFWESRSILNSNHFESIMHFSPSTLLISPQVYLPIGYASLSLSEYIIST